MHGTRPPRPVHAVLYAQQRNLPQSVSMHVVRCSGADTICGDVSNDSTASYSRCSASLVCMAFLQV
jgi:hypothetical protein